MSKISVHLPTRRSFLTTLTSVAVTGLSSVAAQQPAAQQRQSSAPQDPFPNRKKVLAIGDVHTGYQHDSVSHALATIERLGRQTGEFVTYIRTDTQLITKSEIYGTGKYAAPPAGTRRVNAKNLN